MTDQFVSSGTAITIAAGVVIAFFYVKHMWAALQKSVRIRNDPDEGREDKYRYSLVGAVISVFLSYVAIAAYGLGPALLYLGPVLALVSPIAVTYCLYREALD